MKVSAAIQPEPGPSLLAGLRDLICDLVQSLLLSLIFMLGAVGAFAYRTAVAPLIRPLLLSLVALAVCLSLVGRSTILAPEEFDTPPRQELWFWHGGEQLDHAAFVAMASEVLSVMPIVPFHDDLVSLLSETVATESSFGYAVKDRSGITLGVYQILLTTAEYIMRRLEKHPEVRHVVLAYMDPEKDLRENLMHNLHFQTAMAIAYYWMRAGDKLLEQSASLNSRARLYKREWNTPQGKATEAKYIRDSKKYISQSGL